MRSKPKGMKRFTREQLLKEMRKFIKDTTYRNVGLNWMGVPVELDKSRCFHCHATVKRGHKPHCPAKALAWNIEFELWLMRAL